MSSPQPALQLGSERQCVDDGEQQQRPAGLQDSATLPHLMFQREQVLRTSQSLRSLAEVRESLLGAARARPRVRAPPPRRQRPQTSGVHGRRSRRAGGSSCSSNVAKPGRSSRGSNGTEGIAAAAAAAVVESAAVVEALDSGEASEQLEHQASDEEEAGDGDESAVDATFITGVDADGPALQLPVYEPTAASRRRASRARQRAPARKTDAQVEEILAAFERKAAAIRSVQEMYLRKRADETKARLKPVPVDKGRTPRPDPKAFRKRTGISAVEDMADAAYRHPPLLLPHQLPWNQVQEPAASASQAQSSSSGSSSDGSDRAATPMQPLAQTPEGVDAVAPRRTARWRGASVGIAAVAGWRRQAQMRPRFPRDDDGCTSSVGGSSSRATASLASLRVATASSKRPRRRVDALEKLFDNTPSKLELPALELELGTGESQASERAQQLARLRRKAAVRSKATEQVQIMFETAMMRKTIIRNQVPWLEQIVAADPMAHFDMIPPHEAYQTADADDTAIDAGDDGDDGDSDEGNVDDGDSVEGDEAAGHPHNGDAFDEVNAGTALSLAKLRITQLPHSSHRPLSSGGRASAAAVASVTFASGSAVSSLASLARLRQNDSANDDNPDDSSTNCSTAGRGTGQPVALSLHTAGCKEIRSSGVWVPAGKARCEVEQEVRQERAMTLAKMRHHSLVKIPRVV